MVLMAAHTGDKHRIESINLLLHVSLIDHLISQELQLLDVAISKGWKGDFDI